MFVCAFLTSLLPSVASCNNVGVRTLIQWIKDSRYRRIKITMRLQCALTKCALARVCARGCGLAVHDHTRKLQTPRTTRYAFVYDALRAVFLRV